MYNEDKVDENIKEEIIRTLRNNRFKITEQRMMVIDYLVSCGFNTSKQTCELLNDINKEIGISTVYRTISILKKYGFIPNRRYYNKNLIH